MYSKIRNFANYPENPPGGASGTEASFRVSMGGIQIPTFLALLLLLDGSLAFWLGSRGTRVVNPLRKAAGAAEGRWRPAPRFAGGELILTEDLPNGPYGEMGMTGGGKLYVPPNATYAEAAKSLATEWTKARGSMMKMATQCSDG